jgi:hypothetical protein
MDKDLVLVYLHGDISCAVLTDKVSDTMEISEECQREYDEENTPVIFQTFLEQRLQKNHIEYELLNFHEAFED